MLLAVLASGFFGLVAGLYIGTLWGVFGERQAAEGRICRALRMAERRRKAMAGYGLDLDSQLAAAARREQMEFHSHLATYRRFESRLKALRSERGPEILFWSTYYAAEENSLLDKMEDEWACLTEDERDMLRAEGPQTQ
jgi:hypothetical protein